MQKIEKEDLLNQLKEFFNQQAAKYEIELAFLYGSCARGMPKAESDIDIAVVFSKKALSETQMFDILNELSVAIAKEVSGEVNILPILPDFNKPMLYYNAIVLGKPIYIQNRDRYAQFFIESIYRMEDFSLFGTKWQLVAAAKNLEGVKHG